MKRESHHTRCTQASFLKFWSVRFAPASSVFKSLVVVLYPRYGLTYGSVRPVSSVPGPMTATGLTGRCGSFFYAFFQSALRAFSLFDAAFLFYSPFGYDLNSMLVLVEARRTAHPLVLHHVGVVGAWGRQKRQRSYRSRCSCSLAWF